MSKVKCNVYAFPAKHYGGATLSIDGKMQHLYITSKDEVKEVLAERCYVIYGKLCLTEMREDKVVSRQASGGGTMDICLTEVEEIVASDNKGIISLDRGIVLNHHGEEIPGIPRKFMDEFMDSVRNNNVITEATVEYNDFMPKMATSACPHFFHSKQVCRNPAGCSCAKPYWIPTNKEGFINITPIIPKSDLLDKEGVRKKIKLFVAEYAYEWSMNDIDEWVDDNC